MRCTPLSQYNHTVYWGGNLVYAAVTDNTGTSHLELLVGEPAEGEPQTLFDWFRKVWLTLSTVDTNTAQLAGKISDMSDDIASMKLLIERQNATVGGGCYFTVYSKDYPFLDTFKVRVTDGTSTKSSYINYNEDSEYYAAELRVPTTSSTVDVFILDPDTNEEQVKLTATDVNTTSGYANINLDPLFAGAYATPLQVNKKLATVMYKSSIVTQNTSWLPTVCNNLANHQEHFQDFLLSCAGLSIQSQNFEQLYANESEFLSVVTSNAGSWLLANSTFGKYVANSRSLLRSAIDDNAAVSAIQSNATFLTYMQNTLLPTITIQSSGGNQLGLIAGNYFVMYVQSGCMGAQWSGNIHIGRDWQNTAGYGSDDRYFVYKAMSHRGNSTFTLNSDTKGLFSAYGPSQYGIKTVHHPYTGSDVTYEFSPTIGQTSANTSTRYIFCNEIQIQSYSQSTVNFGNFKWAVDYGHNYYPYDQTTYTWAYYDMGSLTSSPTADSVITYIDLDAVD